MIRLRNDTLHRITKNTIPGPLFIFVSLCMTIFMSCNGTDPDTQVEKTTLKSIRSEKTTGAKSLSIGLIPEHNIFKQIERHEPLVGYIEKKTGIKINLKSLTRYGNIINNFLFEDLDAAFLGSFTYTLAHTKLGVEAIARPVDIYGISSYHGLIFVRKGSGIKSAKEMKGKVFAFVDKATTAGYLFPLAYFKKQGVEDYSTYFKETYFTGTHQDAIYDVLDRKADIGAAKNTVFNRISTKDPRLKSELDILEKSIDVPENGLAVRKDLDTSIKNRLRETLLNMHNDPEGKIVLKNFGVQRYIETTDNDYAELYGYIQSVGLDLATYYYENK